MAEHRFERKVSWAVRVGDRIELFTHVAAPAMTRLRQPERVVLETLVDAGVARSRAEAPAWCVKLFGQQENDWLAKLREAMTAVADARARVRRPESVLASRLLLDAGPSWSRPAGWPLGWGRRERCAPGCRRRL